MWAVKTQKPDGSLWNHIWGMLKTHMKLQKQSPSGAEAYTHLKFSSKKKPQKLPGPKRKGLSSNHPFWGTNMLNFRVCIHSPTWISLINFQCWVFVPCIVIQLKGQGFPTSSSCHNWLVVEPTHLKNIRKKMGSSSPRFGVKIQKKMSCHHIDNCSEKELASPSSQLYGW